MPTNPILPALSTTIKALYLGAFTGVTVLYIWSKL